MAIYEFEGYRPSIASGSFIYSEATIIGAVKIGEGCYIGPGARIRGDWGEIIIGSYSNIQENCVIHNRVGGITALGTRSHIGHGAILHGPMEIGEHVVVGMGAVIMDGVKIGDGCCVAAGALIVANTVIPPHKLVVGVPGRVVSDVLPPMKERLEKGTVQYMALPQRCFSGLKKLE
jgi:carbonic anhydrase/acetyltransferase-like protein (isoleucine patch superfamily)